MDSGVAGGRKQGPEEGTLGQTPVKTYGIHCGPLAQPDGPTEEPHR